MARQLRKIFNTLVPGTIQTQMIFLVSAGVLIQIVASGLIFGSLVANVLEVQIGKRALNIAKTVAEIPQVRHAVLDGDPSGEIQKLTEALRLKTGAEFIVVGEKSGRRLSHPNPEKIGKYFVGGDAGPALRDGKTYVSKAVGTLGPSLRGIVPVTDDNGAITGFVAVGYLIENVDKAIRNHQQKPTGFVVMMILTGILTAVLISNYFKKAILGLEPAEIASLYQERSVILESIREGIIAIDARGSIRLVNKAALDYTGLSPELEIAGHSIDEVLPEAGLTKLLKSGKKEFDQELNIGGKEMIFNMVPVSHLGEIVGIVASFRRKDELDLLTRELSQVREYSDMLRVQAHEYSNKLHTIAGLIQLEAHQEALELILKESSGYQALIQFLGDAVPHSGISALIIGKYNLSQEMKIDFVLDRESSMRDIPGWINQEKIVTILGNLINNALDSIRDSENPRGTLKLSMTDLGEDLIFEVEDSGKGIALDKLDRIFEKGVTTKGEKERGVGLFIVQSCLTELGGSITVSTGELNGALFTVMIPKNRRKRNEQPAGTDRRG